MSGHGHVDPSNKKIALLISLLALSLAISETLGNSVQIQALSKNIEASNLWSFFQAKTIRMTTLRAAADAIESANSVSEKQSAVAKKMRDDIKRYDSEPETGEGRKELAERAKAAESARDRALAAHHHYELASAITQIGIVVASASIVVSMSVLGWIGLGAGLLGIAFIVLGYVAPTAMHLF